MMSVIASICHTKYGHQSTFDETHRTVFVGFIVHQYNYVTMLSVFTVIFLRVSWCLLLAPGFTAWLQVEVISTECCVIDDVCCWHHSLLRDFIDDVCCWRQALLRDYKLRSYRLNAVSLMMFVVGARLYCVITSWGHIDWMLCHFISYKNRKKTYITQSSLTFRFCNSCSGIILCCCSRIFTACTQAISFSVVQLYFLFGFLGLYIVRHYWAPAEWRHGKSYRYDMICDCIFVVHLYNL